MYACPFAVVCPSAQISFTSFDTSLITAARPDYETDRARACTRSGLLGASAGEDADAMHAWMRKR